MDDTINIFVLSGGGAVYGWSSQILWGLSDAGLKPSMIGSTSTGTIAAFMYSKGLYDQNIALCDEVFSTNARAITKPGIASIDNGKIKINWLKALSQLAFNKNKIVSLMDNSPLVDTLTKIDNEHPGFPIDIFYNEVDLMTGRLVERNTRDVANRRERITSMVASTSIPGVWPLIEGRYGDAGIREGTPLSAMFERTQPGKKYRIIVISCNNTEMAQYEDLNRIDRIIARTVSIAFNEMLINDLGRSKDRNEVAKAIASHRYQLSSWLDKYKHNLPLAAIDEFGALSSDLFQSLPFNNAPIYILEYKGPSTTFSFTTAALKEQRETARVDVDRLLTSIKS